MTLGNIISLINGQLLNEVTISSFNSITNRASKVQRGDLFICTTQNEDAVDEALNNGAYGIIFDQITPKLDNETAWIRVNDANLAQLKLLRFHLMPQSIEVFYTNTYTLEYISMLQIGQECHVINHNINDIVDKLWNLSPSQKLILKKQDEILTLFPMAKEISPQHEIACDTVSLFESDIQIENLHYKRLKVPAVLQEYFMNAIAFLQQEYIPFKLDNTIFPKSFTAISTDNALSSKDFGKGSKIHLFTFDTTLAAQFIEDISIISPWIKTKIFLNENLKNLSYNQYILFSNDDNLRFHLKEESFDIAVIIGAEALAISSFVKPVQANLFQPEI